MSFICFLSILALTEAFNDDPAEYTEYIVRLGDPWQVTCETPYREPTQWRFNSALLYYNYHLFFNGKLVTTMEDRYMMKERHIPHEYILKVIQTDINHAGLYQCHHKNSATQEGSQYYKLTLVDRSNIELLAIGNSSIKLIIDISYVGFRIEQPVFHCTFQYGAKIMNERICMDDLYELFTCNLEIIYGPDDDPPLFCQIRFQNNNKMWNATKLSVVKNSIVSYVREGESYSVSCDTASTTSMSWYFNGVLPSTMDILLYDRWLAQPQAHNRYNFTYSNDRRTYSMMIAHVDTKHAGMYLCTHKSTRHLVEKEINLIVIENSSIEFSKSNSTTLRMSTAYVGHNVSTPMFQCISKNSWTTSSNMECHVMTSGSTKCQVMKIYELVGDGDIPNKCQILMENYIVEESYPMTNQPNYQSEVSILKISLIIVSAMFLATILVIAGSIYRRRKTKQYKILDEERARVLETERFESSRTIVIKSLKNEPINIKGLFDKLNVNVNLIEHIEKYNNGGSCAVTFHSHEDASLFRNKFIETFGTSPCVLIWPETWPVRHDDACRGMEIINISR